jgi:hypothetical protein
MKPRFEKRRQKRQDRLAFLRMRRSDPTPMPPRWRAMRRIRYQEIRLTVYAQVVCATPGYSGKVTL